MELFEFITTVDFVPYSIVIHNSFGITGVSNLFQGTKLTDVFFTECILWHFSYASILTIFEESQI